jgi:hypothetical protein
MQATSGVFTCALESIVTCAATYPLFYFHTPWIRAGSHKQCFAACSHGIFFWFFYCAESAQPIPTGQQFPIAALSAINSDGPQQQLRPNYVPSSLTLSKLQFSDWISLEEWRLHNVPLLQKCPIAIGPFFIVVTGMGWPVATVISSHGRPDVSGSNYSSNMYCWCHQCPLLLWSSYINTKTDAPITSTLHFWPSTYA